MYYIKVWYDGFLRPIATFQDEVGDDVVIAAAQSIACNPFIPQDAVRAYNDETGDYVWLSDKEEDEEWENYDEENSVFLFNFSEDGTLPMEDVF